MMIFQKLEESTINVGFNEELSFSLKYPFNTYQLICSFIKFCLYFIAAFSTLSYLKTRQINLNPHK